MTRNDGGIHRGDLTRPAVATEDQTALNGGDYWTRTASTEKQPNNYQFTGEKPGDNAAKVAATQAKTDAPGTYTVKDKDSLWSIASRMVRDSNHPDKSDKFKLDVVKGLVEKNKGSIKGLEANPDKIRDGQVLKTDDVRELAKLGHGKVLNTHYKPKEKADSEPSTNETNRKEKIAGKPIDRRTPQYDTAGLGDQRYGDQRFSDPRLSDQRFGDQRYGDQQFRQQRPLDLGPMKDIIGMIGMFAGGAMRDRFDDRRHWNHHHGPRGYYDGYSQNYYDGGNYGFGQQHPYRHHQQFRQFQEPMEYSHYGRPQHNFNHPMHRSNEFRVQQLESQYRNQQQQQQFQQQLVLQQRENRIQQQQIQQLQREQQQREQQWQRNPHQRHQHQFRTQA